MNKLFPILALLNKIKIKWKIKSNFQLLIILLVFGVTGSTATWISKPILDFTGVTQATICSWVYWPIRIIIIFPLYQILLLIFGALFGQYNFFKNFTKKMFIR
ncbi:MAG: diacylglyceryl transferase [Candidatus Marinimicrobia bacterium]|nr:diacylglyceryl transferase [Candidatus Neomarinimicrobiota bacterium]